MHACNVSVMPDSPVAWQFGVFKLIDFLNKVSCTCHWLTYLEEQPLHTHKTDKRDDDLSEDQDYIISLPLHDNPFQADIHSLNEVSINYY